MPDSTPNKKYFSETPNLKKFPQDLAFALIWLALAILTIYIPGVNETVIRVIFAVPVILFIPGYLLIAALFPQKYTNTEDDFEAVSESPELKIKMKRSGISGIERFALSVGLSLAVVPLIGLMLNYTPFGIRLNSIVFSLVIFTGIMVLIALFRRAKLPDKERFSVPFGKVVPAVRDELFPAKGEKILDRQWKLVLLLPLFCLITVGVFLLATPPATGYEDSIYTAYPLIFWILTCLIFLFPLIYILISRVKHTAIPFNKKSIYGLLIIAAINLVLLLHIPKARGYLMNCGGDALTHIGYCVDILNSGHMLTQNHYPLSHIELSVSSMLTGATPQTLSLSTISVVIILFILGIIALSRSLRFTTVQTASIAAFAIIPTLGVLLTQESIMPSTNGWAFIPLFLMVLCYLLFSRVNIIQYLICWLILCAAMCFYHPEAVLFPAIMTVAILVFCIFWNLIHKEKSKKYKIYYLPIIPLLLIFVAGFLIFFLSTNVGRGQLATYIDIIKSIIFPVTTSITNTVAVAPISDTLPLWKVQNIANLCTSFFGGSISLTLFLSALWNRFVYYAIINWNLLLLSALCLLTSIWYLVSKKFHNLDKRYLAIIVLFFLFVAISIIFVTVYPEMWTIQRMYKYPVIFGIFILGILFSDFICSTSKSKIRRILSILSTIAIIFMLIFSMTSLYRSSSIGEHNYQITNEDVEAMHLLYEYKNIDYLIEESGMQHQSRYIEYIYGINTSDKEKKSKNIRSIHRPDIHPQSNFGYGQYTALGQAYKNPTYYLKTPPYGEYKRWLSDDTEYWPLGGRNDFGTFPSSWKHLTYDSSVDKIQDGNAIEVYLIHPVS